MTIHTATYSPEDNKIRLYASARLDAETYAKVKAEGFMWAPKQELFVSPKWTPKREDLAIELAGEIEPEEMTLAERATLKAERLDGLAHKRHRMANAYSNAADDLSQAFAHGQPILVGHHSEAKARRTQAKMQSAMTKANESAKLANYWLYRATGVEHFANMKNSPRVRAGRIKTLLVELRDIQRDFNESHMRLKRWEKFTSDDLIIAALGRTSIAPYGVYDELRAGKITPQEARVKCIAMANNVITSQSRKRWIDHILNRLAYERELLGTVPRYEGELTPVILQAFAREHGAHKPEGKRLDDELLSLQSEAMLPLHLSASSYMELNGDEWRDLMQSVGYEVPEKGEALPLILNLDVPTLWAKDPYGRQNSRAPYRAYRVVQVTKAIYGEVNSDHRGTQLSFCGQFRFKIAMARLMGKGMEGKSHEYVAVFLTDAKAHNVPETCVDPTPQEVAA